MRDGIADRSLTLYICTHARTLTFTTSTNREVHESTELNNFDTYLCVSVHVYYSIKRDRPTFFGFLLRFLRFGLKKSSKVVFHCFELL